MGESTDSGNEAGSDVPDRSNPNEMRAREQAAVRSGTVTDSSGKPVTSRNRDGTESVVTTGTDFERSMAQQDFARETGNPLSRGAQDLAASVAQREQDSLQRAADAGRLAGAPAAGSALANVGDVTQSPVVTELGRDPGPVEQEALLATTPMTRPDEVILGGSTGGGGSPFSPAEVARVEALGQASRDAVAARAPLRDTSIRVLSRRLGSTSGGVINTPERNAVFNEIRSRALSGDADAQKVIDAEARALNPRISEDELSSYNAQRNVGQLLSGIAATPQAATAANVLGTSPADMARMATADAGMITDQGPLQRSAMPLVGQQNVPANVDQSAIDRAQFPNAFSIDVDSFAVNAPGGGMMSVPVNQTPINQSNLSPMQLLAAQQNIFGDDYQPPVNLPVTELGRDPGPVEQDLQTTAPIDYGLYGGYEDDSAYDADIFGVPRYAGGQTGLDGRMQGFSDARQMGDFVGSATEGNFLTSLMGLSPIMALTGTDPKEANRQNVQDMMEAGAQFNQETGKLQLDTGRGTLNMSDSGTVTYSGMPNPSYTGPFANLVNPPQDTGDGGEQIATKAPTDPCPAGYQLIGGVCQPVDDVTQAPDPSPPGSDFVINPTTGLPTLFTPATQATQVGQINPFVLQPNAPQQIAAPQGIQALSPTGAALGRQV